MKYKYILVLVIFIIAIIAISSFFLPETLNNIINNILNNLLSFFALITLLLLGSLAIIDLLDRYGIEIYFYSKKKDIEIKKRVEETISHFYEKEYEFLKEISCDRISYLLDQLGLNADQFEEIKYQIIKLRQMSVRTMEQSKEFMHDLCTSNKSLTTRVLTNTDKMKSDKCVYKRVKYYINLSDICYEEVIKNKLARCLLGLIHENLKKDVKEIDYIVIPEQSNLLLGIEVGILLKKPVVKILEHPRMNIDQYWDGNFNKNSNIIIIHDVLVTGEQVEKCVSRLKKENINKNYGAFCLIDRIDCEGKEYLKKWDIKTYSVLELSDKMIEENIKNNN